MKRLIAVMVAVAAALVLMSQNALAERAGSFTASGYGTVRLFNDPAVAKSGRDGHCYRAQDLPRDWTCTVDTISDPHSLAIYRVEPGRVTSVNEGSSKVYAYPTASSAGEYPYCRPLWVVVAGPYHAVGTQNAYYCAFWSKSARAGFITAGWVRA